MIRFYAKIAGQKAMSALPGGPRLYDSLQGLVTRSTVPTPSRVRQKVEVALAYLRAFERLDGPGVLARGPHVDIGAGWHFTVPLVFWQLGCERQFLVDIRPLARAELVFQVVRLLKTLKIAECDRRPLPDPGRRTLSQYLTLLGMTYLAPAPGALPLRAGGATLITSTQTLLHPPRKAVRSIFAETARVLRTGGLFGATIHLYDLYSDFDPGLNRFNFLRYDERTWERWFNSGLMTYNRLRSTDYAQLFSGLPFRTEVWEETEASARDRVDLERLQPDPGFALYPREDLAKTHLMFVMRRT